MNPQLQVLIALQDILLMIRETKDPSQQKAMGKIGFKLTNLDSLEGTRDELEKAYEKIRSFVEKKIKQEEMEWKV